LKELIHNGVLVPKRYEPIGFHILLNGKPIQLNAEQEEMAVAWVKKLGTPYVNDPVFVRNFFEDFGAALGLKEKVTPENFDFSEIIRFVEKEKQRKLTMTREEKKILAESRKAIREANKARYGYAIVDGVKVEIANYVVEPPGIFMGRGEHPLRGRWKPGATENDIILNLSPGAPIPPGNWKEIVWQPDCMWIAKWDDKLRGKEKYVWLSDSATVKQRREREKFDKARELEVKIEEVRKRILAELNSDDPKIRKIATVSYLIDVLKLRVGDEKDKDEADTVGATTLRREHVSIGKDGVTKFDFLGKDSVRWRKEVQLPEPVTRNIRELIAASQSPIFKGIRSDDVNKFLGELMPGLTAKVFRTYHATKVVREYLEAAKVSSDDPDYVKKYIATMANLQAAIICNHKRALPKKWRDSLLKKLERLRKLKAMKTKRSAERAIELEYKIKLMKATRDYNLGTSLKSYIDPRVYIDWMRKVNFDWRRYYPKTLQRKFSWVEGSST
jgi:DNA topoisomerase-1